MLVGCHRFYKIFRQIRWFEEILFIKERAASNNTSVGVILDLEGDKQGSRQTTLAFAWSTFKQHVGSPNVRYQAPDVIDISNNHQLISRCKYALSVVYHLFITYFRNISVSGLKILLS
ncbi:hypothetical protein ACF0H5_011315 [Mactra antiquata]